MVQCNLLLAGFLLASQLLSSTAQSRPTLTKTQAENIAAEVTTLIRDSFNASKFEHPILGTILRLSFHDCAGSDGCDGCLNTSLPENSGLDEVIEILEDNVYQKLALQPVLSRADFWALAATAAVNYGIKQDPFARVPPPLLISNFRYGRPDCPFSPSAPNDRSTDFPSAMLGNTGVLDYFLTRFKFNASQSVAIMGAHSLGRAHDEYSGFNESWVEANSVLGTEYYSNLIDLKWRQQAVSNGNMRWVPTTGRPLPPPPGPHRGPAPPPTFSPPPAIMMTDADMALHKDIGIPSSNGAAGCPFSTCPLASKTYQYVLQCLRSKGEFLRRFADAFLKMLAVCGRPSAGQVKLCTLSQV